MSTENQNQVTAQENTSIQQVSVSPSERFTGAIMKHFSQDNGCVQITPFQKRLCQSYFIKIDQMLKSAELKRMSKAEQNRDSLPYSWENVNMNKLAVDVVAYSSVGLDPMQKNHLHPIPYKNNALNKYDISFTKGYNGIELVAKKYGIDVPDDVIIKIVYAKEIFTPIYKDAENKKESFKHKPSENPFDKGDIIGGYYYHVYFDTPEKNKLRVLSMKDIDKRIPKTASVEFWGGEKDKWEYDSVKGRNVKKGTEEVEGWKDEMVWKTIKRAAWEAVNIDSQKIDDNIQNILYENQENEYEQLKQGARTSNIPEAEIVPQPEPEQLNQNQQPEKIKI